MELLNKLPLNKFCLDQFPLHVVLTHHDILSVPSESKSTQKIKSVLNGGFLLQHLNCISRP